MSKPEFGDYLNEYAAEGVGNMIYDLVSKIVRQIARHYPPERYSPNRGVWDEDAINDVVHKFILVWLLNRGWLEYYLFSLQSVDGLKNSIRRELRRFLINERRRDEYSNLFKRAKKLLKENALFELYEEIPGSVQIWGLRSWKGKAVAQNLVEVLDAMRQVQLPPSVKYRPDSKKLSHVIRNVDLLKLLRETFENLQKKIELTMFMEAMRYRLNLTELDEISFEETITGLEDGQITYADTVPDSDNLEVQVSAETLAEDIFEMLSDRQRRVLFLYLTSPNAILEQIATDLSVSKSTVHLDLKTIERLIAPHLEIDESDNFFSHLSELCNRDTSHDESLVDKLTSQDTAKDEENN
ncbi:MAG: hypothetical protein K8F91_20570 [Candidatus Obscuribacterales bacterium]|nr:hypothetical protein [Candidatus Obscuribacterales bacterium]